MSRHKQVQLIVIDDSARFAFHVWRYVGRSISVGGADQQISQCFWPGSGTDALSPRALETPDGYVAVWWVPGTELIEDHLRLIIERLPQDGERLVLIDMRGQSQALDLQCAPGRREFGDNGEGLGRAALSLVAEVLPKEYAKERFMLVSSYESGSFCFDEREYPIRSKSPETMAEISRQIHELTRPSVDLRRRKIVPRKVSRLHILVTGAGFEVRDEVKGGFGLPPTEELLREMGSPFGKGDLEFEAANSELKIRQCKLPCLKGDENCGKIVSDLDSWWDYVLERQMKGILDVGLSLKESAGRKMWASIQERSMRDAFRKVILKYDWGQLTQALNAARLNWHAWLTTNYTRFSDRAIALVGRDRQTDEGDEVDHWSSWQIVSTSIEALSLAREVLHREEAEVDSKVEYKADIRYLFKLHGDIAHLQTMAAAGQDKEFFSRLGIPIDSLHQVYTTAENFLASSLQKAGDGHHLVWHIVGHRLEDWLLRRLIAQVSSTAGRNRNQFVVVSPGKPASTADKLKVFLRDHARDNHRKSLQILWCQAYAEDYLARIGSAGELPEGSKPAIENWLKGLGLAPTKA